PFSTTGSAPLDPSELTTFAQAPMPAMKSHTLQLATSTALPAGDAVTALAALTAPVPQPRLIMSPERQPEAMTAYLAPQAQSPNAKRSLEMIIARETATAPTVTPATRPAIVPPATVDTGLRTASLGGQPTVTPSANLFSSTLSATTQSAPVDRKSVV